MPATIADEAKEVWEEAVKKLSHSTPHYRSDNPNVPHILNAVESIGVTTVTLENVSLVIEALKHRVTVNERWTEAPASWNIRYDNAFGAGEQITLRGERYGDIAADAEAARKWVLEHTRPVSGAQQTVTLPAPALPQASAQSVPQAAPQEAACMMIEVGTSFQGNKPQLKFYVAGFDKPLTYTRPIEDMVKLLTPLGFTAAHIIIGQRYTVNAVVTHAASTKDGKTYHNVVSVRAA